MNDLINLVKVESEVAVKLFSENKRTVNPDKFKSIILTKSKSDDTSTRFSVATDIVFIDNRLNFNLHINAIVNLLPINEAT